MLKFSDPRCAYSHFHTASSPTSATLVQAAQPTQAKADDTPCQPPLESAGASINYI